MSPRRSALVLAAMALLSLLSASLFHETLSASIPASTGYINVRIESAEVEEGGNVCTVVSVSDYNTIFVQVNGQSGDACLIKVIAQNDGTVPARLRSADVIFVTIKAIAQNNGTVPAQLSGVRVHPEYTPVEAQVVVDGPVLPGRPGTVKFRLVLLEDFQSIVEVWLTFVMGLP